RCPANAQGASGASAGPFSGIICVGITAPIITSLSSPAVDTRKVVCTDRPRLFGPFYSSGTAKVERQFISGASLISDFLSHCSVPPPGPGLCGPPGDGRYGGYEFHRINGLGYVHLVAGRERALAVLDPGVRRQRYGRDLSPLFRCQGPHSA